MNRAAFLKMAGGSVAAILVAPEVLEGLAIPETTPVDFGLPTAELSAMSNGDWLGFIKVGDHLTIDMGGVVRSNCLVTRVDHSDGGDGGDGLVYVDLDIMRDEGDVYETGHISAEYFERRIVEVNHNRVKTPDSTTTGRGDQNMGQADRRGTREERAKHPKPKFRLRDFLMRVKRSAKAHSKPLVTKRERARRKRAIRRTYALSRRECGAIGAGHREAPKGFDMAMYRAKTVVEL